MRPAALNDLRFLASIPPCSEAPARRVRAPRLTLSLMRQAWAIRLRLSGFHDLESAEDPDGPLSNVGQPSHLDRMDGCQIQQSAAYYRRVGELATKLPFYRDRLIAEAVADGWGVRTIKVRLKVGQGRIERVLRIIRGWLPPENWADREDDGDGT